MSEQKPNEDNLRREFESLGRNLVDAMRAAWESPESKRLRDEVVTGLNDLGTTLKKEADTLASSPAAQQVREGVEQVGERLRSTDVQTKVRGELLGALQTVNSELQKVIDRWMNDPSASPAQPGETPNPTDSAKANVAASTLAADETHSVEPGLIDADPYRSVPPGGGSDAGGPAA